MKKKGLSTLVTILVIILLVLVVFGVVWIFKNNNIESDNNIKDTEKTYLENLNESQVSRGFSSTSVAQGTQLNVDLNVFIRGSETYYTIEEYIPAGWIVTNDGGGATEEPDRLVWAVLGTIPLKDASVTYTVQAPVTSGSYNFDGIYMFEGDPAPITTIGETTVTVS